MEPVIGFLVGVTRVPRPRRTLEPQEGTSVGGTVLPPRKCPPVT
jgi:hypothetical protein